MTLLRVKTLKKNEPMQAKIWNHRQWVNETDPDTLRAFYDKTLREAGFRFSPVLTTILNRMATRLCGFFLRAISRFTLSLSLNSRILNFQVSTWSSIKSF